jgi:hypothetical protein
MRIIGLCLLGLISYLLAMIFFFPAAPVVDRIRPQLGSVALEGVSGRLFKGVIDAVRSTDDLLPLELRNVGWTLAPQTLLKGGAGASITFDGYGGQGRGLILRKWNGDLTVNDFQVNLQAKDLEPLMPVPVASFSGEIRTDIADLQLVDKLLTRLEGKLIWQNAVLESPVPASLGTVNIDIQPDGEQSHVVALDARGGDVTIDGTVTLTLSGDFSADVMLTPSPNASAEVVNGLRQMGRADDQGRVRIQQQGNVNRLM